MGGLKAEGLDNLVEAFWRFLAKALGYYGFIEVA